MANESKVAEAVKALLNGNLNQCLIPISESEIEFDEEPKPHESDRAKEDEE